MYQKIIKEFIHHSEPLSEMPTAPMLCHFKLLMDSSPTIGSEIEQLMHQTVFECDPSRKEKETQEQQKIMDIDNVDILLRMMRRGISPMAMSLFIDKALQFEQELIPLLIQKITTSLNDCFVESSIRILGKSELWAVDQLIDKYPKIRMPHTQSLVLLLLGFKADEKWSVWIIEQYHTLHRLYPDESYHEGALLAILEMQKRMIHSEEICQ